MKFSQKEKTDLFYAGLMISLAFAILLGGGINAVITLDPSLLVAFFVAFLTAGSGFLLHELMHKVVAQSYGLWAEFRANYKGLWLAIGLSLFGFIIAAPGAVWIRGQGITREQNGKISLAGPVTNIVLALAFLVLGFFYTGGLLGVIFSFGLRINSLLAAFNMIPVMPFDGSKIKDWNVGIYTVTVVISVGLFILSFFI